MTGREALTSSRQAFEVVDAFEQAVARYTGARYCVAMDSGCNALFLSLCANSEMYVELPKRTYIGVAMACLHAGKRIRWKEHTWSGIFCITPTNTYDAALRFTSGMYLKGTRMCLSFQASKLMPIGRGGAVIHDDPVFDRWARRGRNNGRTEGALCGQEVEFSQVGWTMYMTPPDAARGLWLLTYYHEHMPDQLNEYADISQAEVFA
jgi:dTDP-4-amino-4,6-dideoxygalactose transaminase